nr:hypothetical protein CFP56_63457 [Quercus suber]
MTREESWPRVFPVLQLLLLRPPSHLPNRQSVWAWMLKLVRGHDRNNTSTTAKLLAHEDFQHHHCRYSSHRPHSSASTKKPIVSRGSLPAACSKLPKCSNTFYSE